MTIPHSLKKARHQRSVKSFSRGTQTWLLICFLCSALSFYVGTFVGWNMQRREQCDVENYGDASGIEEKNRNLFVRTSRSVDSPVRQLFPKRHVGSLVSGVGLVNRIEFATRFDMGVPLDPSTPGNDHVVILYSHEEAIPSLGTNISNVEDATRNCENLHVILTHAGRNRQCVALMGQYESFHVQKFMRLPPGDSLDSAKTGKLDMNYPLRLVNRGAQSSGRMSQKVPTTEQTLEHWRSLKVYFSSLDGVLDQLRPIAQQVASHNENNAVIVMVCNFGQSELLLNCRYSLAVISTPSKSPFPLLVTSHTNPFFFLLSRLQCSQKRIVGFSLQRSGLCNRSGYERSRRRDGFDDVLQHRHFWQHALQGCKELW